MQEQDKVTCGYCQNNPRFYIENEDEREVLTFFCRTCQMARCYTDPICDRFVLRQGMYTTKWYPGKVEDTVL